MPLRQPVEYLRRHPPARQPALGIAAACGLVLYFLCAAGAHIRARDTRLLDWINWSAFFSLAVAALVVALAYRSPL